MVKLIIAAIAATTLVGCAGQVKIRTETIEVYKPILYCPAPNWEAIDRPVALAIEGITADSTPGEVAKRYKATVKQLQGYSKRLETSLTRYDKTHEAYETLRMEFAAAKIRDGFNAEKESK